MGMVQIKGTGNFFYVGVFLDVGASFRCRGLIHQAHILKVGLMNQTPTEKKKVACPLFLFLDLLFYSSAQMFAEKSLHCSVEIESIFFISESMSLIIFNHVFDFYSSLLQGFHDLV